jgi:DNA polymerase III epsilon subunit family exonuclease
MEIVFFDLETTIPQSKGEGFDVIEFGAIVLDKVGLYEKESYSTLLHSERISKKSIDCNGITQQMVVNSPTFAGVADKVFDVLNNRIWAGHNIQQFDIPRILESFKKIDKKPPESAAVIDTLPLLREAFGKRAGDLKLASLGNYFGLGQERHRAIEDCRMNIEVLKNCSMILFLEENTGYDSSVEANMPQESAGSESILDKIDSNIISKDDVWISYNGGTNPMIPRRLKMERWVNKPFILSAYCYQSQIVKNFSAGKIIDVRSEYWEIQRES